MALAYPDHLCKDPSPSEVLGVRVQQIFCGVTVQPMWDVCIGIGTHVRIFPILLKGNRFGLLELSV